MRTTLAVATFAALVTISAKADAFCGFYVAGSDQHMYNDATQVVLMREGTRTVLSMQNNYKGPPEAFALVVPVPVVLHEGDVRTLPKDVFDHVELMGAPRLVEYWEQDPCARDEPGDGIAYGSGMAVTSQAMVATSENSAAVKVEARFTVGEYQIVILSAKEATGLADWLRANHYQIPAGAEPLLRPYVEAGSKFFVAKVDPNKVKFEHGRAALSPLRFHYDSEEFSLPIRLGLASSSGTQDLIVNILAPNQRYRVANYPNVAIPTNLDVKPVVKDHFAAFYAALFDRTVEHDPHAVVTEYSWQAGNCDPCPGPVLTDSDFQTLGADVLGGTPQLPSAYQNEDFVLTRLHARYGPEITADLVFERAPPIEGGREHDQRFNEMKTGFAASDYNNFQARYAIRHAWTGPLACTSPQRGRWGGPPADVADQLAGRDTTPIAALGVAFAPRDAVKLETAVVHDLPQLGLRVTAPAPSAALPLRSGCGCHGSGDASGVVTLLLIAGTALGVRRRSNRTAIRRR